MFLRSGYVLIVCVLVKSGFCILLEGIFLKRWTFLSLGRHVLRDIRLDVLRQHVLRDIRLDVLRQHVLRDIRLDVLRQHVLRDIRLDVLRQHVLRDIRLDVLRQHVLRDIRDVLQNENCNFRKGPGTRCEKNGACSRISTRKFVWTAFFANKFFVSRSDFREVNPVVQLVQNGDSVGSFRSTGFASIFFAIDIWTSVMFSWSTFGLWWVACRMAFWTWCSSRRPSIQFELAMDLILRLRVWKSRAPTLLRRCHRFHERAVGEERSAKIFHRHRTRNHPKELIPHSASYEARLPDRPVKTSHTTCRHCHDQQSDRTETSIFCLQNDVTVRRTVTTFVCPQTQFHENLHTNFALQNLPIRLDVLRQHVLRDIRLDVLRQHVLRNATLLNSLDNCDTRWGKDLTHFSPTCQTLQKLTSTSDFCFWSSVAAKIVTWEALVDWSVFFFCQVAKMILSTGPHTRLVQAMAASSDLRRPLRWWKPRAGEWKECFSDD